jgi:hypothetical protein
MATMDYSGLGQPANGTLDFFSQIGTRSSPRNIPFDSSDPWSYSSSYQDDHAYVNFDEWVDWPSADGEHPEDMDLQSNFEVASIPGLTSDTSDDRGASPSSPIGGSPRAELRALKQHDDALTVPQRESSPEYSSRIPFLSLLDHQKGDASLYGTYGFQPGPYSSDPSARTPIRLQKHDRGRRTKPLVDRDAVAEVRDRGACLHCRIRRVKVIHPRARQTKGSGLTGSQCDAQNVCEQCHNRARKSSASDSSLFAQDICIRYGLSQIGPAFEGTCGML